MEYPLRMRLPAIRLFAFISVLAALVGVPSAVSASGPQSQPPAGQAQQPAALAPEPNLTMVTIDFRALARDGKPVLDLKPEEVTLKIGGKARDIVALELIKAGGDIPPIPKGATAPPPAPLPPFLTNAPIVGGRSVTLLVDDEVIEPGHEEPVRNALSQLVEALTPEDHVGLSTVKGGVVTYPTVRHDRVLADIAALKGREGMATAADAASTALAASARGRSAATSPTTPGADPTCRTRMVHDALMNEFENVVPSVPTVIVLVSTGLTAPTTSGMSAIGGGAASTGSASGSACEFSSGDLSALTTAAATSRAHVYGLEPFRGVDVSAGFENFANLTGNARVRLSGDTKPAMTRIANETLAYYVAAFEVTDQERNGSSQRVAVTVARPGVEVKPQPTVVIAKPAAPGAKVTRPKVRDLLSARKTYRDVPLRATVHTSRASQDGKLRVVCVFDSSDPEAKIAEAGAVLFDTTGKARVQWTAQPADLKSAPVVAAFTAPEPGNYKMRLAVIDASGAAGTINEDVRVASPSPGAPLVSALVLGTKAGSGFTPRLQFVDEQVAIAMVEVFGVSKTTNVEAKFEFAAFEDGPALGTLVGVVQTPPNHDDMRVAFVSFPIEQMPAGDFVVRAVIGLDGQPLAAKPFHTLRKVER